MNEPVAALKASGISKSFGSFKAVDDVSFQIAAGECIALLGPNGAGKTTTCEMLEGLVSPDTGSIEILGYNLRENPEAIKELIGAQLQQTNLYGRFTVRETLALFASFYKTPVSIDDLMRKLDLTEKAHTQIRHLSGGQKQRVYLGSSLVNNPKLIFLDEPTTGLDPESRRSLWRFISELKKEGSSVLLTTHYIEEAEFLADRVLVMDKGKIISEGTPSALKREFTGQEVVEILPKAKEDAERFVTLFQNEKPSEEMAAKAFENVVEVTCKEAAKDIITVLHFASSHGIDVKSVSIRKASLEDVFLKLTGRKIASEL